MIVWTRITWYSKLLAAIFFIFLFPALTFFLGKEYAYTESVLREQSVVFTETSKETLETLENDRITENRSGVIGQALHEDGTPYQGSIAVSDKEDIVTTTVVRADGKFLLFLEPGQYTLTPEEGLLKPVTILVQKNLISQVSLSQ